MKLLSFKILLIIVLILCGSEAETFTQTPQKPDSAKYHQLLPDYMKLQFAGGIGFVSVGVGYTFFKDNLEVSYFYGYIPKFVSTENLLSVSLQITAKLLRFTVNNNIELLPLNFGWFIHHNFGSDYWIKLPSHYPSEYYWWSPGRNAGVFLGGEIKTKLLANETPASGTAFYFRLGSRGLYLASKYDNSSIPLNDILEFGFGVAVYR